MGMICVYCKHPEHVGCKPEELTSERAQQLWDERTASPAGVNLALTPFECEAIHVLWARMPGYASHHDAFERIRSDGFHAALMATPLRRGDRVKWQCRNATIAYARVNGPRVEAYSIVLDDRRADQNYTGTIVKPDELTEALRQMTRSEIYT